jgi:hypothetical protein
MFYQCCGFYCAFLAAIGVYFFAVLAYWQSQGSRFLAWNMEKINDVDGPEAQNFQKSFFIVIAVSTRHIPSHRLLSNPSIHS